MFSAGFGANGTGTDLSTADFQIFLNKYMTVVAGFSISRLAIGTKRRARCG